MRNSKRFLFASLLLLGACADPPDTFVPTIPGVPSAAEADEPSDLRLENAASTFRPREHTAPYGDPVVDGLGRSREVKELRADEPIIDGVALGQRSRLHYDRLRRAGFAR